MGQYDNFVGIVKNNIHTLHENSKTRKEIETHLEKYGISKGELQKYFNNTNEIDNADIRVVALIGEQIYVKSEIQDANLEKHFTKNEIKEIHEYYNFFEDDFIDYPIVLQDVTMVNDGDFYFNLSYQFVAQLYNSHKLNYNYDVQRSPKYKKRKNEVVKTPFINQKSVKEITEHLLNGTLVSTSMAYNVALGSSDSLEDITYNSKKRTLTINDGARIDILDGMHRTLACVRAYAENKNLNFN